MGRMKEYAVYLSRLVYQQKMSDEQIINTTVTELGIESTDWIKDQIKVIREHPELYKEMH